MLVTIAAANIKKVQIKKYSVFINSEAEPHAMYSKYERTRTLCVLQYSYSLPSALKLLFKFVSVFLQQSPSGDYRQL